MEDYKASELRNEKFIIMVTSTFGSGEPPDNGKVGWKFCFTICIHFTVRYKYKKSTGFCFCL